MYMYMYILQMRNGKFLITCQSGYLPSSSWYM